MNAKFLEKLKKCAREHSVKDNYNCVKCRDLGYIFEENNEGGQVAIPCECLAKRLAEENLSRCGLSEVFKKKTFKTYNCEDESQLIAKNMALDYCENFFQQNESIIISGKSGTGKTHLGIAIMLYLIKHGKVCKYVEYNNMMVSLKQSVMDEENHMREMEKLMSPKVLFVDDFLKGKCTEADLNYIYRIVNGRYLLDKPFIISTERSVEEIISWDEAVGTRLVEMAGKNIIHFDQNSENYRLRR